MLLMWLETLSANPDLSDKLHVEVLEWGFKIT